MAYKKPQNPLLQPLPANQAGMPTRPPAPPAQVSGISRVGGSVQGTFGTPPPPPGYGAGTFTTPGTEVAPGGDPNGPPPGSYPGGPNAPPYNPPGGGGQQGQCPAGQVWRTDSHMGTPGPGCEPPDWRSKQGIETCTGARPQGCIDECVWCDFNDAQFKCDGNCNTLGGYGHGGGGGGGGGGGKPGGPVLDPGQFASEELWKAIQGMLNGPSRYTPSVMSSLLGGTKLTAETNAQNQMAQSNADLALRGIARSGVAAEANRGIAATADAAVLSEKNKIQKDKIDADYQDKVTALKAAQDWLNSLRDYVARMTATAAQKDAAMANIALGYARLSQEMEMLRESYKNQVEYWILTNGAL